MQSLAIVLLGLAAHAVQASPAPPAQLGLCSACHGDDGRGGAPGIPRLAGQDRDYLVVSLQAYREGERPHAAMRAIAGSLSDADIDAFATWYATRTHGAGAP